MSFTTDVYYQKLCKLILFDINCVVETISLKVYRITKSSVKSEDFESFFSDLLIVDKIYMYLEKLYIKVYGLIMFIINLLQLFYHKKKNYTDSIFISN